MSSSPKDTSPSLASDARPEVPLREALRFWWKLGWISFGGPAGQIAIMHEELVERRRWLSEARFLHALNFCMLLPGPEAQQLATYLGWLLHRRIGGLLAGVLFILPSLLLLTVLSWVYLVWGELSWVQGIFAGIKPAVVAIVLLAMTRMGKRVLHQRSLLIVALAAFIAVAVFGVAFPWIVGGAALLGLVVQRREARAGQDKTLAGSIRAARLPAYSAVRSWCLALVAGVGLWAVPLAGLVLALGGDHIYTQMGWFFTKTALLTFGGAYAALPYIFSGAVEHYAWLSAEQMIDGLALGETTPGPLIMIVCFVAFIGGYNSAAFGPEQLFLAGAVASLLVTWFTFLPSFLFILLGAPWVEASRHSPSFSVALGFITAAVVGVIANLAWFFAYNVFWPNGVVGGTNFAAIALAGAAALALFVFKRSVIEVIVGCAMAGLAQTLWSNWF